MKTPRLPWPARLVIAAALIVLAGAALVVESLATAPCDGEPRL